MKNFMTGFWRMRTFVMYQNGYFLNRGADVELNYQVLMIPHRFINHLKGLQIVSRNGQILKEVDCHWQLVYHICRDISLNT